MSRISIGHIINPVIDPASSDLAIAQPITFETMCRARAAAIGDIDVQLFAACFPEDEPMVTDGFTKTPPLERSVLDVGRFNSDRRLPILADILNRLHRISRAEYFIYTNVDIALQPDFYFRVGRIIDRGYDGFVINRRTISDRFSAVEEVPQMLEERGKKHPGFDCFVFRREAFERYDLGTACVGGNWIGRVMVSNVMAQAERFRVFKNLRATFHIGDDRRWMSPENNEFAEHNERELLRIVDKLVKDPSSHNLSGLRKIVAYHTDRMSSQAVGSVKPEKNAPLRLMAADPKLVYHSSYRPSGPWDSLEGNLLRQDPVFIVGYPRSGTTLMQALLASQPGVASIAETHFFSIVRKDLVVRSDRVHPSCIDRVVEGLRSRLPLTLNASQQLRDVAHAGELSPKMLFENIVVDNLLEHHEVATIDSLTWIEKTPYHAFHLHDILEYYPRARIISLVRNPEKAILSRRRSFTYQNEAAWPIQKHITDWVDVMSEVERNARRNPDSLLVLRLEDLVDQTDAQMERVCRFLNIGFDRDRASHYGRFIGRVVHPWESWKQGVGDGIDPTRVHRGGERLTVSEKSDLVDIAREHLSRYGYLEAVSEGVVDSKIHRRVMLAFTERARSRVAHLRRRISVRRATSPPALIRSHRDGKIDVSFEINGFYGKHRSGWSFAVRQLAPLHRRGGVLLDSFVERSFVWHPAGPQHHTSPWVGFVHVPPRVPDWFQYEQSNQQVFESEPWRASESTCRGLYTLSEYHRRLLRSRVEVPINVVRVPTEIPNLIWSWERFERNPHKKIVQIGWWLRKLHSIFQLDGVPHQKVFLKARTNPFFDELLNEERLRLERKGEFSRAMYDTAEIWDFEPNVEYDELLSENIVFSEFYDTSANNLVVESLARATPILVNPLPAVVEYLGKDYPLYFDSLEEAAAKARDDALIFAAHQHLKNADGRTLLSGEYFRKAFEQSEIYRGL